jgi:WG containing repeat
LITFGQTSSNSMKTALLSLLLIVFSASYAQNNDYFLMPCRQGDKWGLCDTLGKVQVKPQYDGFTDLIVDTHSKQSFYFVKQNKATIVINHNNEQQLKEYDSINPALHIIYKNGRIGMYLYKAGTPDTRGAFIIQAEPAYNSIETLVESHMYQLNKDGKKGLLYVSYEGANVVLEPIYDKIVFEKPFYKGYNNGRHTATYKDIIYAGGEDIAPVSDDDRQAKAKEELKRKDEQERIKMVQNLTRDALPEDLAKIKPFEITPNNKYVKFRENGKQGYAHFSYAMYTNNTRNLVKNIVVPAEYDSISELGMYRFIIKQGGKFGILQFKKYVLEPVHDDIAYYNAISDVIVLKKDGKYALYQQKKNEMLTGFEFDSYTFIPKTEYLCYIILQRGGKKLVFENKSLSEEYDALLAQHIKGKYYYIKCRRGNKWGVFENDKIVVPVAYDDVVYDTGQNFYTTIINGLKGVYRPGDGLNIPPLYQAIEMAANITFTGDRKPYRLYKVTKDGITFYTNHKGFEFYKD